jgi:peroxiredoxin
MVFCALPALAAVKVGDRAPDFQLTGVDGKNYALSDYKGRVVVLNLLGWN